MTAPGGDSGLADDVRTLAHQLKSPLTTVLGFTALASLSPDAVDEGAAGRLSTAGHRVLLVLDAVVFATAGPRSGSPEPLSLPEVVTDALSAAASPGLAEPLLGRCAEVSLVCSRAPLRERLRLLLGVYAGPRPVVVDVTASREAAGWRLTLHGAPDDPADPEMAHTAGVVADACRARVRPATPESPAIELSLVVPTA